jgi:hypothetical protein
MTTPFGRLRSDLGHIAGLPEYNRSLILKEPPKSLWSKRTRQRQKNTIDVNESMIFNTENSDSIKDRIVEQNIRKVAYGRNQGSAVSFNAVMNPELMGGHAEWATHGRNPRPAFWHGYYRPIIRNSFDVYRPIGKEPNREVTVEGKVGQTSDVSQTMDMAPDPSTTAKLESGIAITATANPTVSSAALASPESTTLAFSGKVLDYQKNTEGLLNIGRPGYWDSMRTLQPTAMFRGTLVEPAITNPRLKFSPEVPDITAASVIKVANTPEATVPFSPDFVIREVEPITVSATPSKITNIVSFVDIIDMTNGKRTEIRTTLPKIIGQRFQAKIYDVQTGQYVPVQEKDNPKIMMSTKMGSAVEIPVEGTGRNIRLKDYRLIAYTAKGKIPVLVLEPWVVTPKAKDSVHVQVSSNIGTSHAETTDLFIPSFKERKNQEISVLSEPVLPKQSNLSLSVAPRIPLTPTLKGTYFDRVPQPDGENPPDRTVLTFKKKELLTYL